MSVLPVPETSYFHLSGASLDNGSIILPGNWGRVIRAFGWQHGAALNEMALEYARIEKFPHHPSRLDAAFVFLTRHEADTFRARVPAFAHHILYRVSLADPAAASHVADWRLNMPQGIVRPDWAIAYWQDIKSQATATPGLDGVAPGIGQLREMLTLSSLRVEERLVKVAKGAGNWAVGFASGSEANPIATSGG